MKKRYFAQNDVLTATGHRSAYFDTIDDARDFLRRNHGGTIKRRGIGRVYDPVLKDWIGGLWKEIEDVPGGTP